MQGYGYPGQYQSDNDRKRQYEPDDGDYGYGKGKRPRQGVGQGKKPVRPLKSCDPGCSILTVTSTMVLLAFLANSSKKENVERGMSVLSYTND